MIPRESTNACRRVREGFGGAAAGINYNTITQSYICEGKNVPLKTHEQRAFVFSLQLRSCTGIFLHKKCNFLGAAAKRVWFGVSLLKDRPAGFRANIQLTGGTLSLRRGYILARA